MKPFIKALDLQIATTLFMLDLTFGVCELILFCSEREVRDKPRKERLFV